MPYEIALLVCVVSQLKDDGKLSSPSFKKWAWIKESSSRKKQIEEKQKMRKIAWITSQKRFHGFFNGSRKAILWGNVDKRMVLQKMQYNLNFQGYIIARKNHDRLTCLKYFVKKAGNGSNQRLAWISKQRKMFPMCSRKVIEKIRKNIRANKPGTAQVGAISKAQKQQKDFQVFSSTVPEKPKSWTELAHQRRHFEIFHPLCRKSSKKIEGGALLVKKIEKSLTMPKKLKGETLWDFSTSVLSENSKKLKGGPFGEKIRKKVSQSRKYSKGVPFGPFEFLRCKNTTPQAFKVFYLALVCFWSESYTVTLRINVNLKLSGLFSSLFVIRFSLIFEKKLAVGGKQKRAFYLNLLSKNCKILRL